ncbi:MAG: alpha/beta hydrolase, partial [Pseudomonadota bacterium]
RRWGTFVAGKTRKFDAISEDHAAFWTLEYDTQAVFTMGEAVRACLSSPIEAISVPGYFAYSVDDQVVHPTRTKQVMTRWGGMVEKDLLEAGPGDDPMAHVMAGDIFSPGQTAPLAERMIAWLRGL